MFDVGFWEILIIALLALLVLGPEKLPGIVKTAGNWAGRARFMARSLRMQIEQEMAREVTAKREAEAAAKSPKKPDATATPEPAGPGGSGEAPDPASTEPADGPDQRT